MKILAMEKDLPGATPGKFAPLLKPEARCVWELYQSGLIRELYFRGDCPQAVLMLECSSPDEARKALDALPLVQANLIGFDLIPLVPYPGFERLFGH